MSEPNHIHVSFRRLLSKAPSYKVGETVKTTFGTEGKIIEVREVEHLNGKVYLLQQDGEQQLYHESAILGVAQQKQAKLTDYNMR
jgi:hypothetical protein